jgi:hypothetical protein
VIRSRDFINSVHWYVWALLIGVIFVLGLAVAGMIYYRRRINVLPPGKQRTDHIAALLGWLNMGLTCYLVYLVWNFVPSVLRTQAEVSFPPSKILLWTMLLALEVHAPTFYASIPYLMLSASMSLLFLTMTDATERVQRKQLVVVGMGALVQVVIIITVLTALFRTELLLHHLLPR